MHSVYERQAERFDQRRNDSLFEKAWLDRFKVRLPDNGSILDVGCGTGKPISEYFISNGFNLVGVDYSGSMLAFAKNKWPSVQWIKGDMRSLALNQKFDGVIAWNSFFHLTPDEQKATLPILLDHVKTGGSFMTTIGDKHGETDGYVGGEPVFHGSLTYLEYEEILMANGFGEIEHKLNDPECNQHSVLLASKNGEH